MSDIKKIRVGGVDYNISPDLSKYAKKTEIDSLISEVQTKEYYYNDGSNEVVPIKWPDLSTQPSILPYKFMGQYVYEQLIPVKPGGNAGSLIGTPLYVNEPIILRAELVGMATYKVLNVIQYDRSTGIFYTDAFSDDVNRSLYFRLVYTSMPEDNVGYYYDGDSGLLLEDLTTSGYSDGYAYVDLGLPSGLKWAKCNVGASTAIDNGLYFAWGEIAGYRDASSGKSFSWSDYKYNGSSTTLTKYNTKSSYGIVDNLTTLDLEDDAASVYMRGSWRMPSKEECEELLNNTTNTWTTINGVNGWLFTGNNGNTLFLPAAGFCYDGNVDDVSSGYYWCSSLQSSTPRYSWYLYFYRGSCNMSDGNRCQGLAVRGVID